MSPKASPEFTEVEDTDGDGVAEVTEEAVEEETKDVAEDETPRKGPEARRQASASSLTEALYGSADVPATGSTKTGKEVEKEAKAEEKAAAAEARAAAKAAKAVEDDDADA